MRLGDRAVRIAVAAGDDRSAVGQFVFTDLAVEDELVKRGLDHGNRGGEFFEVDQEAIVGVGGRQKGGGRPLGALIKELGDGCVSLNERGDVGGEVRVGEVLDDDLGDHVLQDIHRAPGYAAQVDGVEQERADVDVDAVKDGCYLLCDLAFGGAGRAPDDAGLARLDQYGEGLSKFAGAKGVVGGDG